MMTRLMITHKRKWILIFFALCLLPDATGQDQRRKPNIILIVADDLGIGDVGYNGNPIIQTPHIDRLAARATRFTNFHVEPVCAPTRAALMTGKYPGTTGVYDTYNGGAIMATEEITLPEILRDNGYQTAIVGKWHLGDNYPYRPIDQGFQHALTHRGGGIGQPGDPDNFKAKDSAYFSPVLYKNGKKIRTKGYCSDVFTDEAISFIGDNDADPFFLYVAFNAPHTPLQLPQKYYDQYKDLSFEKYKKTFRAKDDDVAQMTDRDFADAQKVYGMITNIDDNIGRITDALDDAGIAENTIVIFMSDNGPQQRRFKMGYRARKASVYEAGVRVPFFIYGPGAGIPKNKDIDALSAHIDLLPTFAALAGVEMPLPDGINGYSLLDLIKGNTTSFPDRTLFSEWGRGYPAPYQNMSVRKGAYKLVGQTDYQASLEDFELYNVAKDPFEKNNMIDAERGRAQAMKDALDGWLAGLNAHPNNNRIYAAKIGTQHENPVVLNRNDAKGPSGSWTQSETYAWWDVEIVQDGEYDFSFEFIEPLQKPGEMVLKIYPYQFSLPSEPSGSTRLEMKSIKLRKGVYRLEPHYAFDGKRWLPLKVEVRDIRK